MTIKKEVNDKLKLLLNKVKIEKKENQVLVRWESFMNKIMNNETKGKKRLLFWLKSSLKLLGWKSNGKKYFVEIKQNNDSCFMIQECNKFTDMMIKEDETISYIYNNCSIDYEIPKYEDIPEAFEEFLNIEFEKRRDKNHDETINKLLLGNDNELIEKGIKLIKRNHPDSMHEKFICFLKNPQKNDLLDFISGIISSDVSKQNFYEDCQLTWLKKENSNIKKVNSISGERINLDSGDIEKNKSKKNKTSKTFDAFDDVKNVFYILKYTNGKGGAQDNQYQDAFNFLVGCLKHVETKGKYSFCFVFNGTFWTGEKLNKFKSSIPEKYSRRIMIYSCK